MGVERAAVRQVPVRPEQVDQLVAGADPADPRYIVTVRGVGFRIDPDGTRVAPPSRQAVGAVAATAPTFRREPLSA